MVKLGNKLQKNGGEGLEPIPMEKFDESFDMQSKIQNANRDEAKSSQYQDHSKIDSALNNFSEGDTFMKPAFEDNQNHGEDDKSMKTQIRNNDSI